MPRCLLRWSRWKRLARTADIRDLIIKEFLKEDSGRDDTFREMSDIARSMLGLPLLEHRIKGDQEEQELESSTSEAKEPIGR